MLEAFTIQVLLRDHRAENPRWVNLHVAKDMQSGLGFISTGSTVYKYRIWDGETFHNLNWVDDPTDEDLCIPVWEKE